MEVTENGLPSHCGEDYAMLSDGTDGTYKNTEDTKD
jgi:hypothetical protein